MSFRIVNEKVIFSIFSCLKVAYSLSFLILLHVYGQAVTNIIDPKFPLDNATAKMVRAEKTFMNKYYKEKRFHWRNYFGPEGPRPPPFLSMWPAERVGDVHQVTTSQNYWYCIILSLLKYIILVSYF